jgi:hypothetical protein
MLREHLVQAFDVAGDGRYVSRHVSRQADLLRLGRRQRRIEDVVDQLRHQQRPALDFELPGDDA